MSILLAANRLSTSLVAVAALSACSSSAGFSAGGVTSHIPQNYENISTSTASTPSALGGSALAGTSMNSLTAIATTGSFTPSTGRIELTDNTMTFIDPNGPDASSAISSSNGGVVAGGFVGAAAYTTAFATGYSYVLPYFFGTANAAGATTYFNVGFAGLITAPTDMPSGGQATYSGAASAQVSPISGNGTTGNRYENGVSTVNVDFGTSTATVTLSGFTSVKDIATGLALPAIAVEIDQVSGSNLVVSGSHLTGGSWVTKKNGAVVDVVGGASTSTGNGTFFGYNPTNSAPAEVAGVALISGATANVTGGYAAR